MKVRTGPSFAVCWAHAHILTLFASEQDLPVGFDPVGTVYSTLGRRRVSGHVESILSRSNGSTPLAPEPTSTSSWQSARRNADTPLYCVSKMPGLMVAKLTDKQA